MGKKNGVDIILIEKPGGLKMKKVLSLLVLSFMVVVLCIQYPLFAEDSPLIGEMKGFIVKRNEKGEESFTDTNEIVPGQTIEYRLKYTSQSKGALKNIKIIGPIPENTVYVSKSATKEESIIPEYSIDQGLTFSQEPVRYKKSLPDGTKTEAVATPDMYSHVRWNVPFIDGEGSVELKYRVLVK